MTQFTALACGLSLCVVAFAAPASAQTTAGLMMTAAQERTDGERTYGERTYGERTYGDRTPVDRVAQDRAIQERASQERTSQERTGDGELRGAPEEGFRGDVRRGDDRTDGQFRPGGWNRPDAAGRTAAFFVEPRLNGRRVLVEYRRGDRRRAEEAAADQFCRRVGFREGAYYALQRTRVGAALEDVVCIR